jgi:ATP sulfurylase
VELHLKSTDAPVMNISEKHIDVWVAGNITLFARTSENNLYYQEFSKLRTYIRNGEILLF